MPMPNQRQTEKRKDKKAAASISQSALLNTLVASANRNKSVVCLVDELAVRLDSPKSNMFDHSDNVRGGPSCASWQFKRAHGTFYFYDHQGRRFDRCENNLEQTLVYLNRKIDLHNLKLVRADLS